MPRAYLRTYLHYTTRDPGVKNSDSRLEGSNLRTSLPVAQGPTGFKSVPRTGHTLSKRARGSVCTPLLATDVLSKQRRVEGPDSESRCETIILELLHPCHPSLLSAPVPRRERTTAFSRSRHSRLPLLLPFVLRRYLLFCGVHRAFISNS